MNIFFLEDLLLLEFSESDSSVFLYRIVNLIVIFFLFSNIQRSISHSTFIQQKLFSSIINILYLTRIFLILINVDFDIYLKLYLSFEIILSSF